MPEITVTPPKPAPTTPQPTKKRKGKFPTMTKAFFNTIAPGLSSFANESSLSEVTTIEEDNENKSQDDGPELDPEVVATIADF